MNPTSFFKNITLALLLTVFIVVVPAAPQAGASEMTGRIFSETVRGWNVEKKEIPRGRILVTVSDMKGWKGFQSISFVLALKKDLDSIGGVNANKQQTYEYAGGNSDMLGVRQENKALYPHELNKYGLFFGLVITY
jgi:hypothetical protein